MSQVAPDVRNLPLRRKLCKAVGKPAAVRSTDVVEEEDVGLLATPGSVGHPSAAGEADGQVGGKERLAGAGIAVEEGQLAAGEARLPQPVGGPNKEITPFGVPQAVPPAILSTEFVGRFFSFTVIRACAKTP
jgi:hypothetical protein